MSHVTPYAAAKLANAVLAERGIEKTLPPQMFYNYTTGRVNKGKAPLLACGRTEDGQVVVSVDAVIEWAHKYTPRGAAAPTTVEDLPTV
jgi:hypothetical protein